MLAGVVAALLSLVFSGIAPLLYKRGLPGYAGVLEANFVRCLFSIPASLALLLIVNPALHLTPSTIAYIIAIALLTTLLADTSLLKSIRCVGAGLAMALSYTSPVFMVPLTVIIEEEVRPLRVLGAVLVTGGVILSFYARPPQPRVRRDYVVGVLTALLASLSYAVALALAAIAYSKGVTPVELTLYRNVLAATLLVPWAPKKVRSYLGRSAAHMAMGGVLGSVLAICTYYLAMAYSGTLLAITVPGAAPVLTIFTAALIMKENITKQQYMGAAFAIAGALATSIG